MSCNFRYESVVGTRRVEIVSEEEKEKALTLLMNHYHPESVKFNPKFVHMTQCMKIIVNDMTAKRAMPKKDTPDFKVMQFQGEVRSPHYNMDRLLILDQRDIAAVIQYIISCLKQLLSLYVSCLLPLLHVWAMNLFFA